MQQYHLYLAKQLVFWSNRMPTTQYINDKSRYLGSQSCKNNLFFLDNFSVSSTNDTNAISSFFIICQLKLIFTPGIQECPEIEMIQTFFLFWHFSLLACQKVPLATISFCLSLRAYSFSPVSGTSQKDSRDSDVTNNGIINYLVCEAKVYFHLLDYTAHDKHLNVEKYKLLLGFLFPGKVNFVAQWLIL